LYPNDVFNDVTNNKITYPNFHTNWQSSNASPLPAASLLTEGACLGQWVILHIDDTQQHHDPGKRLSSTTQQFSKVTNCHHMLPADHASPLF
jgi:hypothetical protein